MPTDDDTTTPTRAVRLARSDAEHHRRRRRVALAALLAALIAAATLLAFGGGSGSWDPFALRDDLRAELPKLRLEQQTAAAAAALQRSAAQRGREDRALVAAVRQGPFVRQAGSQHREIALTFDDGPSAFTERILDTLRRGRAHATFFVLGRQLSQFPAAVQRAVAGGHEIGDHTFDHADLTKLPPSVVAADIATQADAVQRMRLPRPRLFRPPYAAFDSAVLRAARRAHMLTVLWTVDTSDYAARDPAVVARQVLAQAQPGFIVLMHDGGGNRTVTSKALPRIVRGLRARGYRLVTVSRLLLDNPPRAAQRAPARRSELP